MVSQPKPPFNGFPDDSDALVRLPSVFFTQILPILNDLNQLRLLLYMYWHSDHQQSKIRSFRLVDLSSDPTLVMMMGDKDGLDKALQGLIDQGVILQAVLDWMDEVYYFINNPQGQAAVQAIGKGEWQDIHINRPPTHLVDEKPNIFKLYEENIGVITPMMAEILKDDEATYPASWIENAIKIAVAQNVRTWKYVQAILKRWQKEGFGDEENRRDDTQDPQSYRKTWLKRK